MQIFRPTSVLVTLKYSEKTVYPVLRKLAPGSAASDTVQGEFVGLTPSPTGSLVAAKITAANQYAQGKVAAMRYGTTDNDVSQSGSITVLEGFYIVETSAYLTSGTYAIGDEVALRYDADTSRGVLGPVTASVTHVVGIVMSPPKDATANTPMLVKILEASRPKA